MLYQNLPDYRNRVRPQPLTPRQPVGPSLYRAAAVQQTEPAPTKRRPRRVLAAIFVVAVVALMGLHSYGMPSGIAAAFSAFSSSSSKETAAKEARMQTYKSTVNSLIAAHPDENITVSTLDMSDGSALTLGDQGTYTAASTGKLITAVTLLHKVEQGQMSLTQTINGQPVSEMMQKMIVDSDNDSWIALNEYMTHDALHQYMSTLGWTQYDADANTLLPADMARLMQMLYQGKILNRQHTKLLLSLMQQANKREYVVAGIPAGYTVYHKAGWLDGLMHDVVIITDGHQTIVLAVYTFNNTNNGDVPANQELFQSISRAALAAYFPAHDH